MHDLHAADKILKLALEKGRENKLKKITKIVIELGEIIEHGQRITPKNLEFNIKMLAEDTPAKNAKIIIHSTKGNIFTLKEIYGD